MLNGLNIRRLHNDGRFTGQVTPVEVFEKPSLVIKSRPRRGDMGADADKLRDIRESVEDIRQRVETLHRDLDDIVNHLKQLEDDINKSD